MKKLAILLSVGMIAGAASAVLVIDDNFDSGTGSWNTHWKEDNGPGTGFTVSGAADAAGGIGGSGSMSMNTNRVGASGAVHQTGFSGAAGQGITISAMIEISTWNTNAVGNAIPYKMMVSTIDQAYNNVGTGGGIFFWVNNAVGLRRTTGAVGNWATRSTIGLDNNATVASTSDWFRQELVLTDNAGTYDMTINIYDGSDTLWATQTDATTIAVGTTLYAGFMTDWLAAGDTQSAMGVSEYQIDNFQVDVVPEPATIGLMVAFGGGLMLFRRKLKT